MKAKEAENHRETSATDFPEVPLMGREFHAGQQKKPKTKTKTQKNKPKTQKSNEGGNSLQVSVEELPEVLAAHGFLYKISLGLCSVCSYFPAVRLGSGG